MRNSDSGIYVCVAINEAGIDQQAFTLEVFCKQILALQISHLRNLAKPGISAGKVTSQMAKVKTKDGKPAAVNDTVFVQIAFNGNASLECVASGMVLKCNKVDLLFKWDQF